MINIALIIGRMINYERQLALLNSFRESITNKRLPFNINLFQEIVDKKQYRYAIVAFPPEGSFTQFPNLDFVLSLNAGVEPILSQLQNFSSIQMARLVNPKAVERIAQYATWACLDYIRYGSRWREQQKYSSWDRNQPLFRETDKVAVLGVGQVGSAVLQQLDNLGFPVCGFARTEKPNMPYSVYTNLKDCITQANVIVNTLPLTNSTKYLIDYNFLNSMPKGSCLINVGRGHHINEKELLESLNESQLESAYLDVFQQEPLPTDHPFWSHPKVTVTPHVSGAFNIFDNIEPALEQCRKFYNCDEIDYPVKPHLGY